MDALYAELGRRVRIARKHKRWNQAQLAERIEMSRTAVTNIEGGHQAVPLHVVYQLANALEADLNELLPHFGTRDIDGTETELVFGDRRPKRPEDLEAAEVVLSDVASGRRGGNHG